MNGKIQKTYKKPLVIKRAIFMPKSCVQDKKL